MVSTCGRYQPISWAETASPTSQFLSVSRLTNRTRMVALSMNVSPTLKKMPFQTERRKLRRAASFGVRSGAPGFLGVAQVADGRIGHEVRRVGPGDSRDVAHDELALGQESDQIVGGDELVEVVPAFRVITLIFPAPDDLGEGLERLIVGQEPEMTAPAECPGAGVERAAEVGHVLEHVDG